MSQEQPRSSEPTHPESPGSESLRSESPELESLKIESPELESPEFESPELESPERASVPAPPQTESLANSVQLDSVQSDSVQSMPAREDSPATGGLPAIRTLPEDDEILPQTLLRLLGEAFVAAQPPLKQQSVKALRGTIQLLETAVKRLEAAPVPPKKVPTPGVAPKNVLPPLSKPNTGVAPSRSTDGQREKFQTVWRQLWRSWRGLLRHLRDRLPSSINRKVSDRALTGAIVGILAIALWATSVLRPDQPPTTIAEAPPVVTVTPSPEPIPAPTPIPPIVQAPEMPKPVEISPVPLTPSPPPLPLKLTPEQTLIARIQDQVAAISNQYASDLVQSVQANFRGSRLIVNISDGWYGLSRSQQEQLAAELLRRTQTLDFSKLELVDGAGTLLARSPIVGTEMVLLKRTNDLEQAS